MRLYIGRQTRKFLVRVRSRLGARARARENVRFGSKNCELCPVRAH